MVNLGNFLFQIFKTELLKFKKKKIYLIGTDIYLRRETETTSDFEILQPPDHNITNRK